MQNGVKALSIPDKELAIYSCAFENKKAGNPLPTKPTTKK